MIFKSTFGKGYVTSQAGSSPNWFLRLHCPSHPQGCPGTWAPHATTVISRRLFTCTLRPGRMVGPSPDSEDPTARRWFRFTFRKTAIYVICPYVLSILEYRAGLCGNAGNITCAVEVYHDFLHWRDQLTHCIVGTISKILLFNQLNFPAHDSCDVSWLKVPLEVLTRRIYGFHVTFHLYNPPSSSGCSNLRIWTLELHAFFAFFFTLSTAKRATQPCGRFWALPKPARSSWGAAWLCHVENRCHQTFKNVDTPWMPVGWCLRR